MTYLQNLREVQYPKLPEPVPIHSKKLSPELLSNQTQTVQLFLFWCPWPEGEEEEEDKNIN
jgi:hypothetical protein